MFRSPLRAERRTLLGCRCLKSYHDQSMAQGVRVQLVMPEPLAEALKARAAAEGKTASALGVALVEYGLRNLPPLPQAPAGTTKGAGAP